jgi:iron complex outermembrane recepter protein
MKRAIFFCSMILMYHNAFTQNKITGSVTDQDNLPLPGATIYIAETKSGTISDKNGKYQLNDLHNGTVRIQYSFLGYANLIESVELTGKDEIINVKLTQTAVEADEVVVSGVYNSTQHDNAVKIDVLKIDPHSIKITPNFAEVLTKVPGIDMISKGSGVAKPVIRGLSMNDILILNNGVRFENYQYSDHHPLGIDEFGIENVEIIKGPASLLYGSDAIGGVINFIKEKTAPVGSITGDYNLQLFSNSLGMTNNLGIKGSAKHFYGGFRIGNKSNADYLQGGGLYVPNTRFKGTSLNLNTGFNNSKMALNLFYDYGLNKIGLAEPDAMDYLKDSGRGRNPEVYYMLLNNNLLSSQNKFFLNKFKLEVNSAYQKSDLTHSEGPDEIAIQMALQTITYETRLFLPSTGGTEYIIGFQGFNQINTNLNNREIKLLPDASINNYSAFSLFQYTFFSKLKIQTGIRYDQKSISTRTIGLPSDPWTYRPALDRTYGSFSGSVGTTYNYSEKLLFRANFAAAYRTPNLAELTSNGQHETRYEIGDNNLVPENAFENDLSIHYHTENFTFEIAGFYNIINHYIFISPTEETAPSGLSIFRYKQTNSYVFGGEADLHLHPKQLEWLHFETTFSSVTGKQKNGDYLPFIPAHKLRIELRAEKEKLAFIQKPCISVYSTTAFNQNNAAPDETITAGYSLLDISIGGNIKVNNQYISFGISANNLSDRKYIDHLSTLKEVGYYNPGRNIALSIKIPFALRKNQFHSNYKRKISSQP